MPQLSTLFSTSTIPFQFPVGRKLRIEGCLTPEEFGRLSEHNTNTDGIPCLTVGKVGASSDLTLGHYLGLMSWRNTASGVASMELGIANLDAAREAFAAPLYDAEE